MVLQHLPKGRLSRAGKIVLGIDWKLKYGQRKVNGHGGYLGRDHYLDQPLDFIIERCWLCLEDLPDSGAKSNQILNKVKSSSLKKDVWFLFFLQCVSEMLKLSQLLRDNN